MKLRSLHNSATLTFYIPDYSSEMELPFFDGSISAEFSSPADDFIELSIDQKKEKNKIKFATHSLGKQWKVKKNC